jgi:DNA primase
MLQAEVNTRIWLQYQRDFPQFAAVARDMGNVIGCPCPICGGKDRFQIWKVKEQYYCRQCGIHGTYVGYLMQWHGMSTKEACKAADYPLRQGCLAVPQPSRRPNAPAPERYPDEAWRAWAGALLREAQTQLELPAVHALLMARGLSAETARQAGIGYLPSTRYNVAGGKKKVCLPAGLLLAVRRRSLGIVSAEIRCYPPHPCGGVLHTHWQVAGAAKLPYALGGSGRLSPIVVMESILDAVLLHQESRGRIGVLAMRGAAACPGREVLSWLRSAPRIVLCPDADEGGHAAGARWQTWLQEAGCCQIDVRPPTGGKDIGDAHALAVRSGGSEGQTAAAWLVGCGL